MPGCFRALILHIAASITSSAATQVLQSVSVCKDHLAWIGHQQDLNKEFMGSNFPPCWRRGLKRVVTGSQLVGLENVRQLPGHVVQDAFGPDFEFFDAILSPDQVGFEFMSRERTFSVGLASFHFLAWLWFRSSL